jgi:3-oxoacyl-[acyl-carrier-protein] synthase-3
MPLSRYSLIKGSGSYIPGRRIPNDYFLAHRFYSTDGTPLESPNELIIHKFQQITGIQERRYVDQGLKASDLALRAAQQALESTQVDKETLDYIIVAHNFGDVQKNRRSDFLPALSSRVKHHLGIKNPRTVAYDLSFGCPGWLQGVIQADYFLRSGDASRALVIGAETLSKVSDPHDRDSMIYADGAGAVILEAASSPQAAGILAHHSESYTYEEAFVLRMGLSYEPGPEDGPLFFKMSGRKVYELALKKVPYVIRTALEKASIDITQVHKILLHQANHKMDQAIVQQLYRSYGQTEVPPEVMPMTIGSLGNTSVATIPTLYDLITKNQLAGHQINPGDTLVLASVGAGINVNAMVYQCP